MTASPATTVALDDLLQKLEETRPDLLPSHDEAPELADQQGIALARFAYGIAIADPRVRDYDETFEQLVEALGAKPDYVTDYLVTHIRAAAPLIVALDRWIRDELARPGGAQLLDALWNAGNGLPEEVEDMLIEKAGIQVVAARER